MNYVFFMAARECLGVVLVVLSLARRSAISGKTGESFVKFKFNKKRSGFPGKFDAGGVGGPPAYWL